MARIVANHENDALPTHDFAVFTDTFDTRADFHGDNYSWGTGRTKAFKYKPFEVSSSSAPRRPFHPNERQRSYADRVPLQDLLSAPKVHRRSWQSCARNERF